MGVRARGQLVLARSQLTNPLGELALALAHRLHAVGEQRFAAAKVANGSGRDTGRDSSHPTPDHERRAGAEEQPHQGADHRVAQKVPVGPGEDVCRVEHCGLQRGCRGAEARAHELGEDDRGLLGELPRLVRMRVGRRDHDHLRLRLNLRVQAPANLIHRFVQPQRTADVSGQDRAGRELAQVREERRHRGRPTRRRHEHGRLGTPFRRTRQ